MTTYTWVGTPGTDWFSSGAWTPNGPPVSGDTAVIASGTAAVFAGDPAIKGAQIDLGAGAYSHPAALNIVGGSIGAATTISVLRDAPYATMALTSGTTLDGTILVSGGQLGLSIDNTLLGSGTVQIDRGGTADITGSGSASVPVAFLDDNATLILEDPAGYTGAITGLRTGDRIEFGHKIIVESTDYNNGTLSVFGQGHTLIADLNVALSGTDTVTFIAEPYGHGQSVLLTSQATRTWNGGSGDWYTSANWNGGLPLGGDTVRILSGTASVSQADGVTHGTMDFLNVLLGAAGSSTPVSFAATNAYFGPGFSLTALGTPQYTPTYIAPQASFVATGLTRFQGNLQAMSHGGTLTVDIESDGSTANFLLAGTPGPADSDTFAEALAAQESTLRFTGNGTLTNDGLVLVDGVARFGAGIDIQGNGTIELEAGGSAFIDGAVAATQSVLFADNTGTVTLGNVGAFHGTLALSGGSGDRIDVVGQQVASVDYTAGVLTLLDAGGNSVGSFHATGGLGINWNAFTIGSDGHGGSLLTYTPDVAQTLQESLPVAAVGTTGAEISLAALLTNAFGAVPAYSQYILGNTTGIMPTASYWQQGKGEPANSVWQYDGWDIVQPVTVAAADISHYSLKIGNSIVRTAWFTVANAQDAGVASQYIQYNVWTVNPAVDAPITAYATADPSIPGSASRFGELVASDIVASALRYNTVYNGVLNSDNCNWIADNVAAGAGAVMPFDDAFTDPAKNQEGGFWRIAYRGSDHTTPVNDWFQLTQPGDVVRMGRIDGGGQHTTTVLGTVNPDGTITVYDNGDANDKGQNIIGIHSPTYWTGTDPATITIYRLDPKQQYLITGTGLSEYLQGSVYNDLIRPAGGADLIVGGPGNDEVQGTTAQLNTITFSDFAAGDSLDFTDLGAATPIYDPTSGLLSIASGSSVVATVTLAAGLTLPFMTAADGSGGTLVELACFAQGTRIATPGGLVAVEELAEGMPVRTASGGTAPIVWLGHRRVDCARHPRPAAVLPVRIAAHTFGRWMPARDLYLSPDHAIFVDGVLIPVKHLVNGDTITQLATTEEPTVTYYHIELPRHDVLLAEGLPAESYLDTGGRANFANGGDAIIAHPDFSMRLWEAFGCAPLCVTGPVLQGVRARLLQRGRRRAA